MNLKRTLKVAAAVITLVAGGLALQHFLKPDPPAPLLTVEQVTAQCKPPSEMYPLPMLGFPLNGVAGRHADCLGVRDLMIVVWAGPESERNLTAAKLFILTYVDSQNENIKDTKLSAKLINTSRVESSGGMGHAAFYSLIAIKTDEQTKETNKGEVRL